MKQNHINQKVLYKTTYLKNDRNFNKPKTIDGHVYLKLHKFAIIR